MRDSYAVILRENPDFTRLWLAQVVSLTGDWFNTIVLSALVVRYSPGAEGLAISLFILARFVPPMIISPFAGVLVDRMNRKQLLVWSNLLRAGVVLMFLPLLDNPASLPLVYLLTIVQFVLSSVFEPGQSALIPNLVQPRHLVGANTLVSITWSVMLALGAIIGGVVATLFGAQVALIIDAITFLIAGGLVAMIRSYAFVLPDASQPQTDKGLRDGLRFLRQRPNVASLLLVKFGGSIGNVDALMTIFATQIFVLGTDGQLSLGILYSVFGVGALLGPLLGNRFFNDGRVWTMRRLVLWGFALSAFGWVFMGIAGSLLMVSVGLFIRAMGGSANWTYSTVMIQRTTPDAYMGRVFSIDMMAYYLATVASTLIHGVLIDLVGAQNAALVAWFTLLPALIVTLVWGWVLRWLQARNIHTQESLVPSGD